MPGTFTYYRDLDLTFTAANGDKARTGFELLLHDSAGLDARKWRRRKRHVDGRQGEKHRPVRRFTGSGTYDLSGLIQGSFEAFTVGLAGSLTFS